MDRAGIAFALLAAAAFGASTPVAKILLASIDPWILAGVLYLGAGVGLAAVHGLRSLVGPSGAEAPLRRSDVPRLLVAILAGGVLGPLLLMYGLAGTDAAGASLLLNAEGLATMAIAWMAYRENVDRRLLAGALAILAGGMILALGGPATFQVAALLIVAACVCWGIDNNVTRGIAGADPVRIAMIKGLVAGGVNIALGLLGGASLPASGVLATAALTGFLGYGVSLALFVLALRHLGAARTAAYFSLAPFVGALLAVVLLDEPVTARLIAAAGLMGAGLWLHLAERHDHEHTHGSFEHEHRHRHDDHHRHGHGRADPPGEPHTHRHTHVELVHRHPHYPDLHHRHRHGPGA
jgi:drug/metabolite transporter (DMT)-like permease